METTARVLVVGPGKSRARELSAAVQGNGLAFEQVDAAEASRSAAAGNADLILLDSPILDAESLRLCGALRAASTLPLVVCSFSGSEPDIVCAYEAGADDYLVMPVRPLELSARLRAALRRAGEREKTPGAQDVVRAGSLEVRVREHRVFRDGAEVDLSPIEFRLLLALVREAGRAVSHSKLISNVWGPEYVECRNYLRLYVRYLRSKIESDPRSPEMILNEWGVGYRFEPTTG